MDSNSITLLENFCRTCMNGEGDDDKEIERNPRKAISIFSKPERIECKDITIMELLFLITPQLSIDSGDMLPKTICKNCLERLLNAYKFQKMCIRVEKTLRDMIKEIPIDSQLEKDPLNVIPSDNVSLLQTNVLTHFLKIEVEEPLIEKNETSFSNKSPINDAEYKKCEKEDDRRKDMTNSDGSGESDSDTDEFEILPNNAMSKKGSNFVKRNKDSAQTSEIIKDFTKNSKVISNSKNVRSKNFECIKCGSRYSTRSNLNRHVKMHLQPVGDSRKNALGKTDTKIKDAIEKEKPPSIIIKDFAKELNAPIIVEDSEGIRFEIEEIRSEKDISGSGAFDNDMDSDCEILCNNPDSNKSNKKVKNKDAAIIKEQQTSDVNKDLIKNSKTRGNSKNVQIKNFKCDKCDKRYSTRTNLNRHKKKHFPTVGVSQESTLVKTIDDENTNVKSDKTKVNDDIEEEKQTSAINIGSTKEFNARAIIEDSVDVGFETEESFRGETMSDSDSEWLLLCNNSDSNESHKMVKNKDAAITREQRTTEITKDFTKNAKTRRNSKNVQSKNFKCDKCDKRYSTRTNLNRHKKKHFPTVGVSQENTLYKTVENETTNVKCDERKIKDASLKKQQTSEITNDSTKTIEDFKDIRYEIEDSLREEPVSISDALGDTDNNMNSEWDILSNNTKSEIDSKIVKRNKKTKRNSKNVQNKNFKCDKCSNRYTNNSNLTRHKKTHIQTVTVSQECTVDKMEEDESINIKCDETKVNDVVEKEQQTSEITDDSTRVLNAEAIIETSEEDIRLEIEESRKEKETSDSNESNNVDSDVDSEWAISSNNGNRNFECKICNNRYSVRSSLYRHTKKEHPQTVEVNQENTLYKAVEDESINIKCDETKVNDGIEEEKQTSVIISDSTKKIKVETGKTKRFQCDKCGKHLASRTNLKYHKQIHEGRNSNFKCDECGKCYLSRIILKGHKKIHLRKKEGNIFFICDKCGKRLLTRKSLERHKQLHLKVKVKRKLECGICQKVYDRPNTLRAHLRSHTGEQPYLCSECGKTFRSLCLLKAHSLRHSTNLAYECPHCPKRFKCVTNLCAHRATVHNEKEKRHVCNICGSAFIQASLLKKHNIYHSGERNYKCDFCDMRFFLPDPCRRHMRIHTGEKPYKCKYCETTYAQSNDLMKHMRVHLGNNVYKCDLCPKGFPLQRELRAHFSTHKNDDEETKARNIQALKDEQQRLQTEFGLSKCT